MKKIVHLFLSVEFHFTLFLFSGYFKGIIDFPMDLTFFFLLTTSLLTVYKLMNNPVIERFYIKYMIVMLMLFVIILYSYFYTSSEAEGISKIIKFAILTLPSFLIPLVAFREKTSLEKVAQSIMLLGVILAFLTIPSLLDNIGGINFAVVEGIEYQHIGRLMGVTVIILIFFFFSKENQHLHKLTYLILIAICGTVLFSTGSRMPVIAFIIGVVYFIGNSIKIRDSKIMIRKELKWIIVLGACLLPILMILYNRGFFTTLIYRIQVLISQSGGGESAIGRSERFSTAFEMFSNNPFLGLGVGSFGVVYNGYETEDYPHNIFLELLSEVGVLGTLPFIVLIISIFFICYKLLNDHDTTDLTWVLMFIYFFLNALVSGDINSNRMLFSSMAFVLVAYYITNSTHKYKADNFS